jgi:Zn finger protein HypA/HybF involved in hydrogenase expression
MGFFYQLVCKKCSFNRNTSGPWEYYIDKKGQMKSYGHPMPCSVEAAKRGIWGLTAEVFCKQCCGVYKIILVEFKKPVLELAQVWIARPEGKDDYEHGSIYCPNCNSIDLVLSPDENEAPIICPKCKKGQLFCIKLGSGGETPDGIYINPTKKQKG